MREVFNQGEAFFTCNALQEACSGSSRHQLPEGVQQAGEPGDRLCPNCWALIAQRIPKAVNCLVKTSSVSSLLASGS